MSEKGKPDSEVESVDLRSHDITDDLRQELIRLLPGIRTEGDKIDFERLRVALGETVDVGKERYGLTWPGKADCFKAIQTPSVGTLRPVPEESVNFDTTTNLFIEGDNLEVLKLLQKSYLGKIKMIYIDPPYNTGNDFIYPDDFSESLQTYLEYTGQVDAHGKKFNTNTDTSGRFHSNWLNMMYPRLYLARNLLSEDGIVFVSIDDNEVQNLRLVMNEVFGEENFLASFMRRRRMATAMRDEPISPDHEYVITFARDAAQVELYGVQRAERDYPFEDEKGKYRSTDLTVGMTKDMRPGQWFELRHPSTGTGYWPPEGRVWRFFPPTMEKHVDAGDIIWPGDNPDRRLTRPRFKTRLEPTHATARVAPLSTWIDRRESDDQEGEGLNLLVADLNQAGTKELRELFGGEQLVEYPKPISLITALLKLATAPGGEEMVLDFFAGSCSTAEATLRLNGADGGHRRFIMVQLPEPTLDGSTASRAGYATISAIGKERVRRVIDKLDKEDAGKLGEGKTHDWGFKVFKLDESNFKAWQADASADPEAFQTQLELHVDHLRAGRSEQDILYELLLKSGFPLTTMVEEIQLADRRVFSIAGGQFLICLDEDLTLELIRVMADAGPERVVCLDAAFKGNDQLKTNAVQIFKTKGVTSFRTV